MCLDGLLRIHIYIWCILSIYETFICCLPTKNGIIFSRILQQGWVMEWEKGPEGVIRTTYNNWKSFSKSHRRNFSIQRSRCLFHTDVVLDIYVFALIRLRVTKSVATWYAGRMYLQTGKFGPESSHIIVEQGSFHSWSSDDSGGLKKVWLPLISSMEKLLVSLFVFVAFRSLFGWPIDQLQNSTRLVMDCIKQLSRRQYVYCRMILLFFIKKQMAELVTRNHVSAGTELQWLPDEV